MSRHVRLLPALIAAAAMLLVVQNASAQTTLLAEDMEADPTEKWTVADVESPGHAPWQLSNSSTPKVRGNQFHGGATSWWAGPSPAGMHPADPFPGAITATYKQPIVIPADGKTTVSFWSLFQNEGDDQGAFEAAIVGKETQKGAWKKVAAVKLASSSATDPEWVPGYCTHRPEVHTQEFEELKGDFSALAGQTVLVRFNLTYGTENRQTSFPCGWYVDDLKIATTGTPGKLGTPATPSVAGPPVPSGETKPTVKFGATKLKGKKATLSLKVSGAGLNKVTLTLLKGRKKVGTAKVAQLPTGSRKVVFKLRSKLKKGAYSVKIAGTYSDGGKFSASGRTKAK